MDVNILIQGGVDINAALELLGDMETYNETLQDFLGEINNKLEKIKEYKEAQDMDNYAILVHSLKSDSKYLGFTKLADLAYNHEMASKAKDVRFVIGSYDALIAEANRILEVLRNYTSGTKAPTVTLVANADNSKKILVADDSNLIRSFVQKMVPAEYTVLVANDGEEAIKIVSEEAVNLKGILLDLNMPKVDGFQVLEFFKSNGLFANVPVTIITGDDSKDTVLKAFDYPIVDVLNKPFTESDVRNVVNKMINYSSVK
ncbi:MAG: response regulator [Bacilli bacterium]|nr:response regulator [Bacilli bacterium]